MKNLSLTIIASFFVILSITSLLTSCNSDVPKWRTEKIDSFALVLKECEEVMDQDKDELRLRIQKINSSLNKLKRFASDTFTHDFIRSIDQYMAAEKIYTKFINHASEMSLELNVLKTQLLSLKNSSDKGMFTDEQFTKFINKERIDILNLHELCEEIAEPINKLEPLYLRTAPRIEAFADSLAKGNINLK